ncbi:MAG TPA: BON domain-containing protein [Gaiellaceae bacterium]|jgi:gas vesicle protein|nr:BON domain-containing protein [Gaiellaceae bacterium]
MAEKRRFRQFLVGGVLGSLGTLFFDPQQGRRRRALLVDRTAGFFRRTGQRAERAGRGVGARVYGMSQQVQHLKEEPKEFDDATLARKVETEIFRDADVPKGQIDVNVQKGVVQLRGEVPSPDMLNDLVEKTRKVQGVRDVESLLHLPGTSAPMHQ